MIKIKTKFFRFFLIRVEGLRYCCTHYKASLGKFVILGDTNKMDLTYNLVLDNLDIEVERSVQFVLSLSGC